MTFRDLVANNINSKTYDIKRPIEESYQKRLARQVVFAPELGKWNYLVKPACIYVKKAFSYR